MTENPRHYRNIDREPHEGDRARLVAGLGAAIPIDGNDLAQVGNGWPRQFEMVQPWWDVDAKPGAKWRGRDGRVRTKRNNGMWSAPGPGVCTALELEDLYGPGELITPAPEPAPEPEPEESKYGDGDLPYGLTVAEDGSYLDWRGEHYTRSSDIAVKPEPVAEPVADIPDEVVDAAIGVLPLMVTPTRDDVRAALAAADAKRAKVGPAPGLTEEQREALKTAESGLEQADLTVRAKRLRDAFPDAFPDPTGGDPVVEALTREGGKPSTLYRCTDGSWGRCRGREHGAWTTDDLWDIRRFQSATIADLMGNTEHTTKGN